MYTRKTQIHMVKSMLEILMSIWETLSSMSGILMPTSWGCFAAYATWYFTSAKHNAPLTLNEAKMLWTIHKQKTQCKARKWHQIRRRGKIVGFKCQCGHKHIQKRPITASKPAPQIHSQTLAFDELHKAYKSRVSRVDLSEDQHH